VDDAQREETSHLIADLPAATDELQLPATRDLHWRDAAAPAAAAAPDDYDSRSDESDGGSDDDDDDDDADDEGGPAASDSLPGLDDPPDLLPLLPGEEPLAAEVALGLVAPQLGAAAATAAEEGEEGEEGAGEESDSEEEDSDAEGAGSEQEAGPAAAAAAPPSREQCYRQVRDAAAAAAISCLPAC
jgi:hypothetical protein